METKLMEYAEQIDVMLDNIKHNFGLSDEQFKEILEGYLEFRYKGLKVY